MQIRRFLRIKEERKQTESEKCCDPDRVLYRTISKISMETTTYKQHTLISYFRNEASHLKPTACSLTPLQSSEVTASYTVISKITFERTIKNWSHTDSTCTLFHVHKRINALCMAADGHVQSTSTTSRQVWTPYGYRVQRNELYMSSNEHFINLWDFWRQTGVYKTYIYSKCYKNHILCTISQVWSHSKRSLGLLHNYWMYCFIFNTLLVQLLSISIMYNEQKKKDWRESRYTENDVLHNNAQHEAACTHVRNPISTKYTAPFPLLPKSLQTWTTP